MLLIVLAHAAYVHAANQRAQLPIKLPWDLAAFIHPDGIRLDRPSPGHAAVFVVGQSVYATVATGETGVVLTETDAAPFIASGRTFVPVRYLANAIGVNDILWDQATGTVTLSHAGKEVRLVIGDKLLWDSGVAQAIDVAPVVRQGRTYLPARYVATAFGWQVLWDEANRAVGLIRE